MLDMTRDEKYDYVCELMRRDWAEKNNIYALYGDTDKMVRNNQEYDIAREALRRRYKTGK